MSIEIEYETADPYEVGHIEQGDQSEALRSALYGAIAAGVRNDVAEQHQSQLSTGSMTRDCSFEFAEILNGFEDVPPSIVEQALLAAVRWGHGQGARWAIDLARAAAKRRRVRDRRQARHEATVVAGIIVVAAGALLFRTEGKLATVLIAGGCAMVGFSARGWAPGRPTVLTRLI